MIRGKEYELKKTELFHDLSTDTNNLAKHSVLGYDYGPYWGIRTYINGYKSALNSLIQEYKERDSCDCDYLDEIIYPILFLSRHIVELYLKALGLRYCVNKYNNVYTSVTASHNLIQIFDDIKDDLADMCNKANLDFDVDTISDYLQQINLYDPDSYCFRYPFDKERNMNFERWISVDLVDFYDKINSLYDYFEIIYISLDNVVDNGSYRKKLGEWLFKMSCRQQDNIEKLVFKLKKEDTDKHVSKNELAGSFIDYSEISYDGEEDMESLREEYISEISERDLQFINLLLITGRELNGGNITVSSRNIKEDFCKILVNNYLGNDFIHDYGKISSFNSNYKILETEAGLLIDWFSQSLNIINRINAIEMSDKL